MNPSVLSTIFIGGGFLILIFATIKLLVNMITAIKKKSNIVNEHFENTIKQYQNNDSFTNITTTQHTKKTIYQNGEKISEVETTTHNNVSPITNCPNCGAKINDKTKSNCEYCHTSLK